MKGSLPIHKYIHDVYKSLSLTTHNTHNTHNPYVYGIGEKKHHRIFGGAFTFVGDIGIINVILLCYMYCRGTRSEKPQKIS